MLDVDDIKIISENTLVDRLIIPDDSIIVEGNSRCYYPEYALIVDEIRNSISIDNNMPEKIYFTRTNLKNNKDFGEELIEDVFKKLGFEIFSPEKLTISEQLKLLRNCKEFATTEGSIAHNVIFCSDNVHMIIVRKICAMISYQFFLNEIRNAKTTYIDAHNTLAYVGAPWDGPFLLKRNRNIIAFASRRGLVSLKPKLSIVAFLQYWKDIIYKSLRYRKRIYLTPNTGYFVRRFFR